MTAFTIYHDLSGWDILGALVFVFAVLCAGVWVGVVRDEGLRPQQLVDEVHAFAPDTPVPVMPPQRGEIFLTTTSAAPGKVSLFDAHRFVVGRCYRFDHAGVMGEPFRVIDVIPQAGAPVMVLFEFVGSGEAGTIENPVRRQYAEVPDTAAPALAEV